MKPAYQEMMEWAQEELQNGNRIKASRIQRVAERMKIRYETEQARLNKESSYCYY